MGLAQSFKFEHNNTNEIKAFLAEFCTSCKYDYDGQLWVIREYNRKTMRFELAVEEYGLCTHRAGEYFEVLGLLLERLTGEFGKVEVDDL
ncbi:MAG: hypothetical protein ACNI25_04695 [Halarcobacter sp.]